MRSREIAKRDLVCDGRVRLDKDNIAQYRKILRAAVNPERLAIVVESVDGGGRGEAYSAHCQDFPRVRILGDNHIDSVERCRAACREFFITSMHEMLDVIERDLPDLIAEEPRVPAPRVAPAEIDPIKSDDPVKSEDPVKEDPVKPDEPAAEAVAAELEPRVDTKGKT